MLPEPFTAAEKAEIQTLFGLPPEKLDPETFKKTLRALRAKLHPDNVEKFGDEAVRQEATERFQALEHLAAKIEAWLDHKTPDQNPADPLQNPLARFAFQEMKFEIRTADKDLKYHLFGAFYRWLLLGDKFRIPGTGAWLIADEDHAGHTIGFKESIRIYLTFNEKDAPEAIVRWLFEKLVGRADLLLVAGEIVPVEFSAMLLAVKRRSFLGLAAAV